MSKTCSTLYRGIAVAALTASLTTLWSGCQTQHTQWGRPDIFHQGAAEYKSREMAGRAGRVDVPRYREGERPAPTPQAVAAPAPAPAPGCGPNQFTLKSALLQLTKQVPAQASLGQNVENTITVVAVDNCANVVITDTIPDGGSYVKSEPPAQVSGKKLTWTMDTLDKGQQVIIKVWYKADKEGCLANCATMDAIPRGCAKTMVGSAKLVVNCSLPANAVVGSAVTKTITVQNVGTAAAENVVVTDAVPANLGGKAETFNVGTLAPGQSKTITLPLKAEKSGQVSNPVVAKASNAAEAASSCPIVINQPGVAITKEGTKEQFLGRTATYSVVVSNTGDTDLQNVVVTDTAPAATKIVSASGAQISGNTATWTIGSLKKGAKETLKVELTSMTPGTHCNAVGVRTGEGLTGNAQACTVWRGVPAILIEVVDTPDPISVGEETTYTVQVTNQGTADDTNIKLVARFQDHIDPVSGAGATAVTVDGKTVNFGVVAVLKPKQVVTWSIKAKGAAVGDHRLKVELNSDMLRKPVVEEESTHVY